MQLRTELKAPEELYKCFSDGSGPNGSTMVQFSSVSTKLQGLEYLHYSYPKHCAKQLDGEWKPPSWTDGTFSKLKIRMKADIPKPKHSDSREVVVILPDVLASVEKMSCFGFAGR